MDRDLQEQVKADSSGVLRKSEASSQSQMWPAGDTSCKDLMASRSVPISSLATNCVCTKTFTSCPRWALTQPNSRNLRKLPCYSQNPTAPCFFSLGFLLIQHGTSENHYGLAASSYCPSIPPCHIRSPVLGVERTFRNNTSPAKFQPGR